MAIEIEKKYALTKPQYDEIPGKLHALKAEFAGEDLEENILYFGGPLSAGDAVLRIRNTETRSLLTYKRRLTGDSAVKEQIEYESAIEDPKAVEQIITALGFQKTLVYEKRRKTWNLGQAEVVLDKLPFGLFMEIEGSAEAIADAENLLGAEHFTAVHETYPQLTLIHGKKAGELTIAKFEQE